MNCLVMPGSTGAVAAGTLTVVAPSNGFLAWVCLRIYPPLQSPPRFLISYLCSLHYAQHFFRSLPFFRLIRTSLSICK